MQQDLFNSLVEAKISRKPIQEFILLGEHLPVITMGRRANPANVLISPQALQNKGIDFFNIERGGDATYHCPGQLIVYPILDLDSHHLGIKDYVSILEEAVIRLLNKYDIKGERIQGATGVWLGKNTPEERKICAIGIKCSRFCSMHGLALNVCSDLAGFSFINPCGFQDKGVTSIEKELAAVNASDKKGINHSLNGVEYSESELMKKIKEDFLDIFLGLIFPF